MGWWARSFGFNFGDFQALHPNLRDTTPQQVARVHRLNRRLYVWTVNQAEDMRRLIGWGVDGIITDDPKLAMDVLSVDHEIVGRSPNLGVRSGRMPAPHP